ncbi:hypothetical protein DLAC_00856 [Tieghemostelium lacteum]|uniref:Uncharacterized protein n=1 Tax=Tieghemostelium lacteum TaxID=361077 RepID=A0A152A7M3_TIELA|nr:hypothetical protein DLAC_00856 [Tieghemostelium lacteum]|eukprot:KYR02057.1 hypothetical protein DLAC_00856 [Tieghemostelium lacteum]
MILPLTITKLILETIDSDVDIKNFLSSCKHLYGFRENIRFNNFPINYFVDAIERKTISKVKLPLKYKYLLILLDVVLDIEIIASLVHYDFGTVKLFKNLNSNRDFRVIRAPPKVSSLIFSDSRCVLDELSIPSTVTELSLAIEYCKWEFIPDSVTSLEVSSENNVSLVVGDLKPTLKKLVFSFFFQKEIRSELFPPSLTYLDLGLRFNYDVSIETLPINLEHLVLGKGFRNSILSLPSTLQSLILPQSFIPKTLEAGIFPQSLKKLKFLYLYPYPRELLSYLINLVDLELMYFDIELQPEMLPPSLTKLNISWYKQPLQPNVLPSSITYLNLGSYHSANKELCVLPISLKHLYLHEHNTPWVTMTLTNQHQIETFHFKSFNHMLEKNQLPNTLKILEFAPNYGRSITPGSLPTTLEEIKLGEFYTDLMPGVLSDLVNLKKLTCGLYFGYKKTFKDVFPQNLVELKITMIPYKYISSLPKSLKILIIRYGICNSSSRALKSYTHNNVEIYKDFTRKIEKGTFPPTLLQLELGKYFHAQLAEGSLPITLESLSINSDYTLMLKKLVLPPNLKKLFLTEKTYSLFSENIDKFKIPFYLSINRFLYQRLKLHSIFKRVEVQFDWNKGTELFSHLDNDSCIFKNIEHFNFQILENHYVPYTPESLDILEKKFKRFGRDTKSLKIFVNAYKRHPPVPFILSCFPKLVKIELNLIFVELSDMSFGEYTFPNLESIKFSNIKLGNIPLVLGILDRCRLYLSSLSIVINNRDLLGVGLLNSYLDNYHVPNLKSLSLYYGYKGYSMIENHKSTLESIKFTVDQMEYATSGIIDQIENLRQCSISIQNTKQMIKFLQSLQHKPKLTKLTIRPTLESDFTGWDQIEISNQLQYIEEFEFTIPDTMVRVLLQLLPQSTNLKSLFIPIAVPDTVLNILLKSLRNLTHLEIICNLEADCVSTSMEIANLASLVTLTIAYYCTPTRNLLGLLHQSNSINYIKINTSRLTFDIELVSEYAPNPPFELVSSNMNFQVFMRNGIHYDKPKQSFLSKLVNKLF